MKTNFVLFSIFLHHAVYCEWSYYGDTGPDRWSSLYPECSKTKQSPIEIDNGAAVPVDTIPSFRFHGYENTDTMENLTVWNDGYTVTVRVHGDLKVSGGGLEGIYALKHFHFHWGHSNRVGSEHFLDGESYPLEMHFVHMTTRHKKIESALQDPKGLAVLGVFAKIGKPHPYFQAIIDNLRLLDIGDYANVRPFPLVNLMPDDTETFYRYNGSLTTPPCSESVVWTVFRQPIEISEFQIQQVRALSAISNITDNFRPLQEVNGRRVFIRRLPETVGGSLSSAGTGYSNDKADIWDPRGTASTNIPAVLTVLVLTHVSSLLLKYE